MQHPRFCHQAKVVAGSPRFPGTAHAVSVVCPVLFDTTSRTYEGEPPTRLLETAPASCTKCRQYRRFLVGSATVRIMIADPSLEVCVPRHLSRLWGRSTAVTAVSSRQNRDAPAETLLGLRQGQLYVAGDSDMQLSRFSRGRGLFVPL